MQKYDDKFLFIMRHAKSDKTLADVSDFDRPLNARGEEEPSIIAKALNHLHLKIERVIVSSARRTVDTWLILEKGLDASPDVVFDKRLYNAFLEDALHVLFLEAEGMNNLMLIGHNPSVSEMCEYFSGAAFDLKPASCVILKAKDESLLRSLQKPGRFKLEHLLTAEI